jgi:hypothetical protein
LSNVFFSHLWWLYLYIMNAQCDDMLRWVMFWQVNCDVNIDMSPCTRDNRCQGPFTFCRQFPVYISGAFALLRVRQMQGERIQVNNSNLYIYFFKGKWTILRVTLSSSSPKLCVRPESMIVDTLGGICRWIDIRFYCTFLYYFSVGGLILDFTVHFCIISV